MFHFLKMFVFCSAMMLGFCGLLLAQNTPNPGSNEAEVLDGKLDQVKADVDKFKVAWDKTRLETTLYDQRAKRAYQRWLKAGKSLRAKTQSQRDKADLELQLSIEKRKLAFSFWQSAQLREAAEEAEIKAFAQDRDGKAIQDKIQQLESKLKPLSTSVSSSPKP